MRFNPREVRLNQTSKNSKIQLEGKGPLVAIFNQLSCCHQFRWHLLPKIPKMPIMALAFNIEPCNKNQTPLL